MEGQHRCRALALGVTVAFAVGASAGQAQVQPRPKADAPAAAPRPQPQPQPEPLVQPQPGPQGCPMMGGGGMRGAMRGMAGRGGRAGGRGMGGRMRGMGSCAMTGQCPMAAMRGALSGANPLNAGDATPAPGAVVARARRACPPVTAELVKQGREVFAGQGNCFVCHGAEADGTALAPSLVAHRWIHIDGSYAAIARLVAAGVPVPRAHPAPMPPMGGAELSSSDLCAVSAYVFSLRRLSAPSM